MRPRLLDLFCGAGGAGEGYHRAGFEVVGCDIEPQPHNPHEFYWCDALEALDTMVANEEWHGYQLTDFSVIHASPPCQRFSQASSFHGSRANYPDLIESVRQRLNATGKPWIIENVERAPLAKHIMLCGTMFGLRTARHRLFELSDNLFIFQPVHLKHTQRVAKPGAIAHGNELWCIGGHFGQKDRAQREGLGIDWMRTTREIAQAIPPLHRVHRQAAHSAP